MSIRRALRWTLPPLALMALAGWLASPRIGPGAADSADAPQQSAGTVPAQGPAAHPPRSGREAHEAAHQVAAVEALGRAGDEGQDQLVGLLDQLPDGSLARREIVPLLHPRDLSDGRAAKLAELLDSSSLNGVEKKQIAFTLSLVGLRDRSALPDSVLGKLSTDARSLLASTTSLATFTH